VAVDMQIQMAHNWLTVSASMAMPLGSAPLLAKSSRGTGCFRSPSHHLDGYHLAAEDRTINRRLTNLAESWFFNAARPGSPGDERERVGTNNVDSVMLCVAFSMVNQ
jgi:hypothetical protein